MSSSIEKKNTFGDRLRLSRETRGLKQADLAERANLHPAAIGHFEKGRRKPSFANIRALAEGLNVTFDYLLGNDHEPHPVNAAFRNAEKLSALDRENIQSMIDVLANRSSKDRK